MRVLTVGSLFAGIAGFDEGFRRAGLRTVWAVEKCPDAQRVLAARFPDAMLHTDVCEVGAACLPPVDVLCGGFPCQDLSVAGKRAGLTGERSGLWWEMLRVVRELRPRLVVWENVPGLATSDDGRDLHRVCSSLAEHNYFGCVRTLDAQHFGVPQRRRRLFGVFARGRAGAGRAAEILAIGQGGKGNTQAGRAARPGTAIGAGDSPSGARILRDERGRCGDGLTSDKAFPLHAAKGQSEQQIAVFQANGSASERGGPPTLAASDDNGSNQVVIPIDMRQASRGEKMTNNRSEDAASGDPPGTGIGDAGDHCPTLADTHTPAIAHTLRAEGHDASEDGTGRGTPLVVRSNQTGANGIGVQPGQAYSLQATGGADAVAFQERGREGGRSLEHQKNLAYSLNAPAGGGRRHEMNVQAGMTVRRLTPRECCRLQGFEDSWLNLDPPLSDSTKYRLLGNAVCVAVSEWLGKRLLAALTSSAV